MTLQQLYDSEINFAIAAFWDGGFVVRIGDDLNGFAAEAHTETWAEAERWLSERAMERYPDSAFAKSRACNAKKTPPAGADRGRRGV